MSLALLLLLTACRSGSGAVGGPVTTSADSGARVTLVTLGSSETSGDQLRDSLHSAWPQLLYRSSLPRRAVYVNLATARSTIANGVADQLPQALVLKPTVATIWFAVSDAFAGTSTDDYSRDLTLLVRRLRATGARVLVVLGPGPSDGDVDVTPFTDRARTTAAANGASVVDLRTFDVRSEQAQQRVADAVGAVLGRIS